MCSPAMDRATADVVVENDRRKRRPWPRKANSVLVTNIMIMIC